MHIITIACSQIIPISLYLLSEHAFFLISKVLVFFYGDIQTNVRLVLFVVGGLRKQKAIRFFFATLNTTLKC